MRKVFAFVLSLILIVSILPLNSFAEEIVTYGVKFGANYVTSENMDDIFGNGQARYVPATETEKATLYLNNLSYSNHNGIVEFNGVEYFTLLQISEPLKIVLTGSNFLSFSQSILSKYPFAVIYSSADVEFCGTGSLTATAPIVSNARGLLTENCNVIVSENAKLNLKANGYTGVSATTYGAYIYYGSLTLKDNATLSADAGTNFSYRPDNNYGLYFAYSDLTVSDNTVLKACAQRRDATGNNYGIYFNGSESKNCNFNFNGGTVYAYAVTASSTAGSYGAFYANSQYFHFNEGINHKLYYAQRQNNQQSSILSTGGILTNSSLTSVQSLTSSIRLEHYYPTYINGQAITNANKDDVLGDGTVQYVPATETENAKLLLSNADIVINSECGILADENLNVYLDGDNTIKTAEELDVNSITAIKSSDGKNLNIYGDDSSIQIKLNSNSKTGIGISTNKNFKITDSIEVEILANENVESFTGIKCSEFYQNNINSLLSISTNVPANSELTGYGIDCKSGQILSGNFYVYAPTTAIISEENSFDTSKYFAMKGKAFTNADLEYTITPYVNILADYIVGISISMQDDLKIYVDGKPITKDNRRVECDFGGFAELTTYNGEPCLYLSDAFVINAYNLGDEDYPELAGVYSYYPITVVLDGYTNIDTKHLAYNTFDHDDDYALAYGIFCNNDLKIIVKENAQPEIYSANSAIGTFDNLNIYFEENACLYCSGKEANGPGMALMGANILIDGYGYYECNLNAEDIGTGYGVQTVSANGSFTVTSQNNSQDFAIVTIEQRGLGTAIYSGEQYLEFNNIYVTFYCDYGPSAKISSSKEQFNLDGIKVYIHSNETDEYTIYDGTQSFANGEIYDIYIEPISGLMGDINGDGLIDLNDYAMFSSYVTCTRESGSEPLTKLKLNGLDFNFDRAVDGFDVIYLDLAINKLVPLYIPSN